MEKSNKKAKPPTSTEANFDNDEDEMKKEKRKQANRESAKRSRLRKQQESEQLKAITNTLKDEVSHLTKQLISAWDGCATLREEITSLVNDLQKQHGLEVAVDLDLAKPDSCMLAKLMQQAKQSWK